MRDTRAYQRKLKQIRQTRALVSLRAALARKDKEIAQYKAHSEALERSMELEGAEKDQFRRERDSARSHLHGFICTECMHHGPNKGMGHSHPTCVYNISASPSPEEKLLEILKDVPPQRITEYLDSLASGSTGTASPSTESVRPGIAPSCGKCRFFVGRDTGNCQRFPPLVITGIIGDVATYFPSVKHKSWCGEFSPILVEREQGGQGEKPNEADV